MFLLLIFVLLGAFIFAFACIKRRRKRTDTTENIYDVIDEQGYHTIGEIYYAKHEFGGDDRTNHDYDEIEETLRRNTNSVGSERLAGGSNRDQHDPETVNENVMIYDVSCCHQIYAEWPYILTSTLSLHERILSCEHMQDASIRNNNQSIPIIDNMFTLKNVYKTNHTYERVSDVAITQLQEINGLHKRAETCEQDPNIMDTAQLLKGNERGQTYERVPNVDTAQLLETTHLYEGAQTYERVPNVDIAQLLESDDLYKTAQIYERVPNVDIAHLQESAGLYERAQTYERVPNVDIPQLITSLYERTKIYERVPDVDIAKLLEMNSLYKSVQIYPMWILPSY